MTDEEAATRLDSPEERQDEDAYRDACAAGAHALRVLPQLVEALEACLKYIPGSEVRSWPPGHRLGDEAMSKGNSALAAAKERP